MSSIRHLVTAIFFTTVFCNTPPAQAQGPLETLPLRGLKAGVAHLLFSAEEGGALPLSVLAIPLQRGDSGVTPVALIVEIDGQTLLEHHRPPNLSVEIYAYAVTSQGTIAHHLAESLTLDPAARDEARSTRGEALAAGGLKFQTRLDIPDGAYTLRVLVRHASSGTHGLRILPLEIPSTVPLFRQPPNRWTHAVAATGAGALPYSPATRPILGAGRDINALLTLQGTEKTRRRGRAEFTTSAGNEVENSADLEVLEATADGLPIRFRVPRLPPGEYRLRFALSGGEEKFHSTAVPVLVVQGDTPEQTLLWTDLRWQAPPPQTVLPVLQSPSTNTSEPSTTSTPNTTPPRTTPPRASKRLRNIATQYRASLLVLAGGDLRGARSRLLQFESAALGRGRNPLGQLRAAEELVQFELVTQDPESLVPVLALHLELYRTYVQRKLHSLVGHSRSTVQSLARLYADHSGNPQLASHALASLAFDLYKSRLLELGLRLSKEALAHTTDHRGALLSLAVGLEKGGDYRGAVAVLERLTETHPTFSEAKLRLAVNLGRTGQGRRAEPLLTSLVEEGLGGWIGALAIERLARRLLATGRAEEASELLVASVQTHPHEAGLQLLRAHLEDRRNQGHAASSALQDLKPQPENPSPIRRYDEWPWSLFEEIHQALAEAAQDRRVHLQGALDP